MEGNDLPRGLRNNNLGNMRPRPADVEAFGPDGKLLGELPNTVWDGVIALDLAQPDPPYLIFDCVENSIRAIGKQLMAYQSRGLHSCQAIFSAWAPPTDNNPTPAYISAVAGRLGVARTDPINTRDPATLLQLVMGIVQQEDGGAALGLISTQQFQTGVDRALGISEV